jgi:PAS domain S-box-containing protein
VQARGVDADHLQALQRHIAEALLRKDADAQDGTLSIKEGKRLLHELRVHQVELEMQNEALRDSQADLDAARERYFDLYDLAPIAYCTINEQGLIWEVNLATAALFGVTRNALLNRPFSRYIFSEDQDIYYLSRKRLTAGVDPQSLELRLVAQDGLPFWAALTIAAGQDIGGKAEIRIVLADISGRMRMEAGQVQVRRSLMAARIELESIRNAGNDGALSRASHILETGHALEMRLRATQEQLRAACSTELTWEQRQEIGELESAARRVSTLLAGYLDAVSAETACTARAALPLCSEELPR